MRGIPSSSSSHMTSAGLHNKAPRIGTHWGKERGSKQTDPNHGGDRVVGGRTLCHVSERLILDVRLTENITHSVAMLKRHRGRRRMCPSPSPTQVVQLKNSFVVVVIVIIITKKSEDHHLQRREGWPFPRTPANAIQGDLRRGGLHAKDPRGEAKPASQPWHVHNIQGRVSSPQDRRGEEGEGRLPCRCSS